MSIQIRKAERKRSKLRIGLSGPSGSGKTYSALLLAEGLCRDMEKVCLIDSENGRGELYSDLGAYSTIPLTAPFSPESYIEAIKAAVEAGFEVVIIDSISHEWEGPGGCLELNERLAATKFKGNTWAAWSETTPRHQKFISAIIQSPVHIITTVRNKIDTVQTDDKKVKKVGVKEITREGFEYELTVNFNIDRDGHYATASKDNTKLFDSRDPFIISAATGEELHKWNDSGKADTNEQKKQVLKHLDRLGIDLLILEAGDRPEFIRKAVPKLTGIDWSEDNLEVIIKTLKTLKDPEAAQAIAWGHRKDNAPEATETPQNDETVEYDQSVEERQEDDLAANL